jgi:hypothetical protein
MMVPGDMEYTNELNVVRTAGSCPVMVCNARYEAAMLAIHEIQHTAIVADGDIGRRARQVLSVLEQVGLIEDGHVTDLKKAA